MNGDPAQPAKPEIEVVRDLRFDNVPFGRTQFAPTLWRKSVTVGAQSLRPPLDWDIILTQVPKFFTLHLGRLGPKRIKEIFQP